MATITKIDVKTVRTEAGKVFYAGVGANDLAVSTVRGAVVGATKKATTRITGVQTELEGRVEAAKKVDLAPKALVGRATGLRDSVVADAKSRYVGLEAEVKGAPAKARTLLNQGLGTVTSTYGTLAKRGEEVVTRLRQQERVAGAVDKVTDVTETLAERAERLGDQVNERVETLTERVEKVTDSVSETVTGVVTGAVDKVGERVAPVRKIVAKRAGEVEEVLEFAAEEITDAVTEGAEEIKDAVVEPKKAPAKKPAATKAPAKPAAKKAPAKKPAAKATKATPAKPAAAAPAKKAPVKKAPAKGATGTATTTATAPAKKAPAKKAPAKKAQATTSTATTTPKVEAKAEVKTETDKA